MNQKIVGLIDILRKAQTYYFTKKKFVFKKIRIYV